MTTITEIKAALAAATPYITGTHVSHTDLEAYEIFKRTAHSAPRWCVAEIERLRDGTWRLGTRGDEAIERAESAERSLASVDAMLNVVGADDAFREGMLRSVRARLEYVERERDEATAEIERLETVINDVATERDEARCETSEHMAKRAEYASEARSLRVRLTDAERERDALAASIAVEDDMPAKTWKAMWNGLRKKIDDDREAFRQIIRSASCRLSCAAIESGHPSEALRAVEALGAAYGLAVAEGRRAYEERDDARERLDIINHLNAKAGDR